MKSQRKEKSNNLLLLFPYSSCTSPSPVSTAHHEDQTYMAVIIVFLTSIIILLAIVMFFTISRHRQRKCFASPLSTKTVLAPHHMGTTSGSSCGSYGAKGIVIVWDYGLQESISTVIVRSVRSNVTFVTAESIVLIYISDLEVTYSIDNMTMWSSCWTSQVC